MTHSVPSAAVSGASRRGAGGWHRALLPAGLVAAGAGAAILLQQVFDPFRQDIPLCITYRLTGVYCPGCGATRCVHALLDGDLTLALHNNALLLAALPVAAFWFVLWTVRRIQGRPLVMPGPRLVIAAAMIAVVFSILRNLPAFSFLAPTSLVGA